MGKTTLTLHNSAVLQYTVYVVSFDGQNFCSQGLPNIFVVYFEIVKTAKALPIEANYIYGSSL